MMGRYKEMMIEIEEQGYDLSGKYVSPYCFDDINLQKTLLSLSSKGICYYSGRRGLVVPMEDATNYISRYLLEYFDDPDQCDLYLANGLLDDGEENDKNSPHTSFGPYLVRKDSLRFDCTCDLFEHVGLLTDYDELNNDLIESIGEHWWIEKDPFIISVGDELSLKWKTFSDSVMHRQRFTFLANSEFNGEPERTDNGLFDILTELGSIINKHTLCRTINEDKILYRARPLEEKVEYTFEQITSPPDEKAKQNRMSPAGVSMFYGALDKETPVYESSDKGDGKGWFLVGSFKALIPLKVLDLTNLPSPITFWMEGFEEIAFLKSFHNEITRHIDRGDGIHVEYIPSQVFTEYLHFMYRGERLDGMLYRSSLTGDTNIVLFCNQKESQKLLKVIAYDEIRN